MTGTAMALDKRNDMLEQLLRDTLDAFNMADAERLNETRKFHQKADEENAGGDGYAYNFFEGAASGTVQASLAYERVRRLLREKLKS